MLQIDCWGVFMKKIALLFLCILFLIQLGGCKKDGAEISDALKQEIGDAWLAENNEVLDWESRDDGNYRRNRLLGIWSDYAVIVIHGKRPIAAVNHEVYIGEYFFSWNSPYEIYCYSNGEFHTLLELYESGVLTDEQVGMIREKFYDPSTVE